MAMIFLIGGFIDSGSIIEESDYVFELTLYYNSCLCGPIDPTYRFILRDDNILYCYKCKTRNVDKYPIECEAYSIYTKRGVKKQLYSEEVIMLIDIADNIYENGDKFHFSSTSYIAVTFHYKGENYFNTYEEGLLDGRLNELVYEVMELSPMSVEFGWKPSLFWF